MWFLETIAPKVLCKSTKALNYVAKPLAPSLLFLSQGFKKHRLFLPIKADPNS